MSQSSSEKKTKTVLIMEDEVQMRFYLMTLVKSLGFEPVMTRNGSQGLDRLESDLPDMIVLDVMMPEKGGALVYQELRSNPRFARIPVLIFSGVDRDAFSHYVRMLNLAPDQSALIEDPEYYVEKTADPDYLKKMILACMEQQPGTA